MNLLISFSGRENGNCDKIANFAASQDDRIICFRDLNAHPCSGCNYDCFSGECKYRDDDVYNLYDQMLDYEKVILIVPMYCGNPSSLYFIFNERCQDYFMHNETYDEIAKRLYIIGVYGDEKATPDFVPCLEKWFDGTTYSDRVLGIQRHLYGQEMEDNLLDVQEVKDNINHFLQL